MGLLLRVAAIVILAATFQAGTRLLAAPGAGTGLVIAAMYALLLVLVALVWGALDAREMTVRRGDVRWALVAVGVAAAGVAILVRLDPASAPTYPHALIAESGVVPLTALIVGLSAVAGLRVGHRIWPQAPVASR